jgi:hypothetical protein
METISGEQFILLISVETDAYKKETSGAQPSPAQPSPDIVDTSA